MERVPTGSKTTNLFDVLDRILDRAMVIAGSYLAGRHGVTHYSHSLADLFSRLGRADWAELVEIRSAFDTARPATCYALTSPASCSPAESSESGEA